MCLGDAPCATVCYPIIRDSSEWITDIPTIFVHVSFLFPSPAVFFLPRQHLHCCSVQFTLLIYSTHPWQCVLEKHEWFVSRYPKSRSRDLDGTSQTKWATQRSRLNWNVYWMSFKCKQPGDHFGYCSVYWYLQSKCIVMFKMSDLWHTIRILSSVLHERLIDLLV